ncbi:MAG: hypothetical protein IH901_01740 [Proteobacteria bacterium]|nr:hypothetical protein [Pseudomonadota bacterium]
MGRIRRRRAVGRNAGGELLRTFKRDIYQGINRIVWGMQRDGSKPFPNPDKPPKDTLPPGPEVVPGEYQITLKFDGQEISGMATVAGDPRTGLSAEALKANYDAAVEVGEMLTTTSEALTRLFEARDDIELLKEWAAKAKKAAGEEDEDEEVVSEQIAADSTENGEKNGEESETPDNPYDAFIKEADATLEKLNELEKNIWTPPDTKGFVDTSYKLTNYIFTASFYVQSSYDAPSATAKAAMEEARRKLAERVAELDAIFAVDIANLRDQAAELELGVLRPVEPLGDS